MKSIYQISETKEKFDLSAIKILFSIIAIILSATTPNALAVAESYELNQKSVLSKVISEIKSHPFLKSAVKKKSQCSLENAKSASTQSSEKLVDFSADFMCLTPGSSKPDS